MEMYHQVEMSVVKRKVMWVLCILLSALPALFLASLIIRYKVDIPVLDQWELVPRLEKFYNGKLTFADLWGQHNEHRPLFPLLIMLVLARLTHWNTNCELAVIFVMAVGIFLLLIYQMRLSRIFGPGTVNWLIPAISLLVFSPCQMENWLWGWQIQLVLNVFAVTAGIVLLAHPSWNWRRYTAAILLGIIAMYSFANGVLYWVVGLFVVWTMLRKDRPALKTAVPIWILTGGATIASYVYRFKRFEGYGPLTLPLQYPVEYLKYVSAFLGATCTGLVDTNPVIAGLIPGERGILPVCAVGAAGVILWVTSVVLLLRWRIADFNTLLPYVALSMYALGSGMIAGLARLAFGVNQALSMRYVVFSTLFWVSLLAFLYLLATRYELSSANHRKMSQRRVTLSARILIIVILCLVISNARHGLQFAKGRHEAFSEAAETFRLLEQGDLTAANIRYTAFELVYPEPEVVEKRLEVLRRYRLSVFRNM